MKKTQLFTILTLLLFGILSCTTQKEKPIQLDYQSYTLANGLKVILHQDLSDPVVTLAIQYHVGSGREKVGKTGFAHFFEHMLFQRSENLPRNAFFQKISEYGGDFNGGTNSDGTVYYEQVPRDALEKVLWMESDRMGFFINTVTQGGLEREIDIVSNEKRQNYDNRAYGHASEIIAANFYPEGHPYSWTTIGKLEDLRAATIEDVKEFYHTFYVPNNATLVISGDFDIESTKSLIETYFGEIPRGADVEMPTPQTPQLAEVKKLYFEDNYAKMPQLSILFPGVESSSKDAHALKALGRLLGSGKNAPLYKVIVEERRLAPSVSAYASGREVAGTFGITVTAKPNVSLDSVLTAIETAFATFEKEGVDLLALNKLKVSEEVMVYNTLTSVMSKALTMANNNEFFGKPDFFIDQLEAFKKVTPEEIMNAYNQYVKGKNYFALSMVPKGQPELALSGSVLADVKTETVEQQKLKSTSSESLDESYEFTPSKIDRAVEPDFLPNAPVFKTPAINRFSLNKGVEMMQIERNDVPLVNFLLKIPGGMLANPIDKPGLSFITTSLMKEGTASKTPQQLEEALGQLGATISINSQTESIDISGSVLSRNLSELVALLEEMILQPRFDEKDLELIKQKSITSLQRQKTIPNSMAYNAASDLLYGKGSLFAQNLMGTVESVDLITMEDVKEYYNRYIIPSGAKLLIVGDVSLENSKKHFSPLIDAWQEKPSVVPVIEPNNFKAEGRVFFIDYPGAQQSSIMLVKRAMPFNDSDYFPTTFVNHAMGSGSNGRLFEELRLKRGYTYGAYSYLSSGNFINTYLASSDVQSSVTKEAVDVFSDLYKNYSETFSEKDLELTKRALVRSEAGAFETPYSLLNVLNAIADYNLPDNYIENYIDLYNNMTLDKAKEMIKKNMNESDMIYIVVGDAKTQLKRLEQSGLGKVTLLEMN